MKRIYIPYLNPLNKLEFVLETLREVLDAEDDIEYVELEVSDERKEGYMPPMKGVDGILFGPTNVLGDLMNPMWDMVKELENEQYKKTPEIVCGAFGIYDFFGEGVSFLMNRLKPLRVQKIGQGVCVQWTPSEKNKAKLRAYFEEYVAAVKARPEV